LIPVNEIANTIHVVYRRKKISMEREVIEFDVVFVGGGPANLSSAIHLTNLVQKYNKDIKDGKPTHYGARTLPCGGYFSIPKLTSDGVMITGDSANLVDSQKLKGLHTSIKSGSS
jgi:flavin-dependent dehydrogenase